MDLKDTPELHAFRKQVAAWVKANLPDDLRPHHSYSGLEDSNAVQRWYRALAEKSWLAFRWPAAYGGAGFCAARQMVFVDQLRKMGAPVPRGFGLSMVGPLILQFGTQQQKDRFLPPIAAHREIWCQGYSEPNAGSDLAALQTRAIQDDSGFVVDGQKIWTSMAHLADWIFVLVRTSNQGRPQQGISFLLIDMKSPGVSIRPIKQIDGLSGFYETFFEQVRVPKDNLLGELNAGWDMAKALLAHERSSTGENVDLPALIARIKQLASQYESGGRPLNHDPVFRRRLAALEMQADCLRYTRYRLMTRLARGETPGPEVSIFKLNQSELCQALYDLGIETMGPDAMRWYDYTLAAHAFDLPMQLVITRAMSIYAGSNEIQRNIIAKSVLNLP